MPHTPAPAAPRLIEKWLPINQLSTEAVRERAGASALPPINWLHVWWARRPLIAFRATVVASVAAYGRSGRTA